MKMEAIKNNSATAATSLAWKPCHDLMLPRWQPPPAFDAKLREKLIARKTLCFSSRNSKFSTRNSKFSTRNSKLSTRTSILEIFEFRGSRIESSRSSFEGLSTYICTVLKWKENAWNRENIPLKTSTIWSSPWQTSQSMTNYWSFPIKSSSFGFRVRNHVCVKSPGVAVG